MSKQDLTKMSEDQIKELQRAIAEADRTAAIAGVNGHDCDRKAAQAREYLALIMVNMRHAILAELTRRTEVGNGVDADPMVCTDYWSTGHASYRHILHASSDDDRVTDRRLIDSLLAAVEANDGDEVVFSVRLTGQRPFGDRRMTLIVPHTYERETEEQAEERKAALAAKGVER